MNEFLEVCERAARAGGKTLMEWRHRATAKAKGPKDFVTEADVASESAIRSLVLSEFPEHLFLGEESEAATETAPSAERPTNGDWSRADYCWIVDPLDGTTNFMHKLQTFAVSVALLHRGELIAGCVYDPVVEECYTAWSGGGAYLNGQKLTVSSCDNLEDALVAASFPAVLERNSLEISRFVEVLLRSQSLRRLGSAALNLAYLAAGRLDAYWATSVKPWDIAAGALLVKEAGGVVTHISGRPLEIADPRFLAAATSSLHADLQRTLALAGA